MAGAGNSMTGDGRAAIEKTISVVQSDIFKSISEDKLDHVFELDRCIKWIKENNFQRVSLISKFTLCLPIPLISHKIVRSLLAH